jgi:hypothetical protein
VLKIELRALCMLDKHSASELHSQVQFNIYLLNYPLCAAPVFSTEYSKIIQDVFSALRLKV